jgi:hypothetical protein
MGDEILMKKLMILPLLVMGLEADNSRLAMVSEYKTMFAKIGQKREGVDPRKIDSVKAPFVQTQTEQKKKVVNGKTVEVKPVQQYVLQAMVGNKAKISGQWYKLGDSVGDLKVVYAKSGIVWLKNSEFKKRLTMRKENAKISIK